MPRKNGWIGGSAGGGGYEYQAQAIAYVSSHILAQRPLAWIRRPSQDIPIAVSAETGGPGDDFSVELEDGVLIEVQAKHGLQKGHDFWSAIIGLARGLERDPSLYGVVITDSTASRTIKEQLRNDLQRLAQGRADNLKPITKEVIARLVAEGIAATESLFDRLMIVVADFGSTSASIEVAKTSISRVIDDVTYAASTWDVLAADGLDLIAQRGRRDAHSLMQLLGTRGIRLSPAALHAAVINERYNAWLHEVTAHFEVLSLDVRFPINSAWIQLRVYNPQSDQRHTQPKTIAEWISSYHEWERLAEQDNEPDDFVDADHVEDLSRLSIIVAGPGAGKTTLLKRIAHRVSLDRTVLFARLPLVSKRMRQGESFEDTILQISADGSGIAPDKLRSVLNDPNYLLVDGLDECDQDQALVAHALARWAAGHPRTTILVTTRPVGYDPGLFPGWKYIELLPLRRQLIPQYTRQFLAVLFEDEARVEAQLNRFTQQLHQSSAATLAARNPLLLSFLIQLSLNGVGLAQRRAELYEHVIDLVRSRPLADRVAQTTLDRPLAWHILEATAWILLHVPGLSVAQLTERLGQILSQALDIQPIPAQRNADRGLTFWEERRILERFRVGPEDAVVFVHRGLSEAAAGRYAAHLGDVELYEWLTRVRRNPTWRETILLASGAGAGKQIIGHLLELDNPADPSSVEAVLATAALAELSRPDSQLLERIAARLQPRLESPVPLVAFEAAEALLGLARQAPAVVGPLAQPLVHHAQPWTQLIAVVLTLACGQEYTDESVIVQLLDIGIGADDQASPSSLQTEQHREFWHQILRGGFRIRGKKFILDSGSSGWHFWNLLVEMACGWLIRIQPQEAVKKIEQFVSEGRNINGPTHEALMRILLANGYSELFSSVLQSRDSKITERFLAVGSLAEADRAFLESLLCLAPAGQKSQHVESQPQELSALGALVYGMRVQSLGLGDWLILSKRYDLHAVDAVLKGVIAAHHLDSDELAAEALWILDQMRTRGVEYTLLSSLPEVDIHPDWAQARNANVSTPDLVRALRHPSELIAKNAAQLLAHGVGGPDAPPLIGEVLWDGHEQALKFVAWIAPYIWKEQALDIILDRLDGPLTRGCHWLLRFLPNTASDDSDQRFLNALLRGVHADDPYIGRGAAEALSELQTAELEPITNSLRDAYDYWTHRRIVCETHETEVQGSSCPVCNVIPRTPRSELVRVLAKLDGVTSDELLELCDDPNHYVQEAAVEIMMEKLANNTDLLTSVLQSAQSKGISIDLLSEILALPPQELCEIREELVNLLNVHSADVRAAVIKALVGGWIDREAASGLARVALQDRALEVRDQATETLRSLEHS